MDDARYLREALTESNQQINLLRRSLHQAGEVICDLLGEDPDYPMAQRVFLNLSVLLKGG